MAALAVRLRVQLGAPLEKIAGVLPFVTSLGSTLAPVGLLAAERQLRPLVLSRKISAGNKTERGAKVTETLTSVFATCGQQGVDFTSVVLEALKNWGGLSTLLRWPRDAR